MSPCPAPHTPLPLRGVTRVLGLGGETDMSPASESDLSHVLTTPLDDPASVLASGSRCSSRLFGQRPSYDRTVTGPAAKRHRTSTSPIPDAEPYRGVPSQYPSNLDDRSVRFIESVLGYQTSILEAQAAKLDGFILSTSKGLDRLAETADKWDGLAVLATQVQELVQEVRRNHIGGRASHTELVVLPQAPMDDIIASPRELSGDGRTISFVPVVERQSAVPTWTAMPRDLSHEPVVTESTSKGGRLAAQEESRVSAQQMELDEHVDSGSPPQSTILFLEPPCGTVAITEPHEDEQQRRRMGLSRRGIEALGSTGPSWTGAVR